MNTPQFSFICQEKGGVPEHQEHSPGYAPPLNVPLGMPPWDVLLGMPPWIVLLGMLPWNVPLVIPLQVEIIWVMEFTRSISGQESLC